MSAASLPLPTGAATSAAQTDGTQRVGGTVLVDGSAVTQPVSGPLTNTQLRASAVTVDGSAVTQPVSVASLPLPTGAATEATLTEARKSLNDVGLTAILEREISHLEAENQRLRIQIHQRDVEIYGLRAVAQLVRQSE